MRFMHGGYLHIDGSYLLDVFMKGDAMTLERVLSTRWVLYDKPRKVSSFYRLSFPI